VTKSRATIALLAIVLLGVAARGGVVWLRSNELTDDRDAYVGIALGVAEGRGYSSPGSTHPTAYRPPLYPLLLATSPFDDIGRWVATLNLLAGAAAIWATGLLALRLGLADWQALLAGLFVAFDPLLVRYVSLPMTETVCTLLVTLLLLLLAGRLDNWPRIITTGAVFGLCALCRPTVWAFAVLMLVWILSRRFVSRRPRDGATADSTRSSPALGALWRTLLLALGCGVVVGPWVVRNWIVFGHPVLNTTHGGYTLLLGNNPRFYAEVVRQPWGTVWDGSRGPGQEAWVKGIQREMEEQGIAGEIARDRWMSRRAWRHIADDPGGFLSSVRLRLLRFWSLTPAGEAAAQFPPALVIAAGIYAGAIYLLALIGLASLFVSRQCEPDRVDGTVSRRLGWTAAILMIVAFMAVHLVYWSNARMRAPVEPAIAVLAAFGCGICFARCGFGRKARAPRSVAAPLRK
jgi:hypothetical protein